MEDRQSPSELVPLGDACSLLQWNPSRAVREARRVSDERDEVRREREGIPRTGVEVD